MYNDCGIVMFSEILYFIGVMIHGSGPFCVCDSQWETMLQCNVILAGHQGWGQIHFIKYKYKYKYIFFQSFKYKYKYKYTGKNLIKYKYKYSSSNTNTNTNTQWGRDKIAAILQMTYSNSLHCKKIVLFIQISLKIVSKGPIYRNKLALVQIVAWCWVGNKP